MTNIFNRSFFRRASLLCMGIAFGLMAAPHAIGSASIVVASALCFVSVGLLSRYGLPS